jgi:cell division protein FtsA
MAQYQVLGLDIGSETIKAIIGEPSGGGKIVLKAGFTAPSRGLRRGVVVDMEAAVSSVDALLKKVKEYSKSSHKNICLKVGGSDVRVQHSRGITAVSRANSEIYRDDVNRVREASEAVNLPPNRIILHTITKEFIVDGVGDIQDPLGMVGARLEVESLILDAFQPTVRNISKCVELAGGSISEWIFGPLASVAAVVTNNQKELGVLLIDIGYGTTGIAVYEENKLLHTKLFPFGAGNITNDLAIALKVPVEIAEKIKLSYGYALSHEVSGKEKIDLEKIDSSTKGLPSRKFISEVIEARLCEICELISGELRLIDRDKKLPAGIVITGGGAKLPGIVELIKSELKLPTQIGLPIRSIFEPGSNSVSKFLDSPEYVTPLGLVLLSQTVHTKRLTKDKKPVLLRFLKRFLP